MVVLLKIRRGADAQGETVSWMLKLALVACDGIG